ncbi:MAG: diguanylate cyclase [Thermodesulfovibrionales bacterium]|nr:diguanylate cyclase [Thermodesulfovibrionales bacterium]
MLAIPALALYLALVTGAGSLWPEYWPYILPSAFVLYFSLAVYTKRSEHVTLAIFAGGLLIAWAVRGSDVSWLHMLYIPYVSISGVFGPQVVLWILLSVPLLDIGHLAGGAPFYEEMALLAICVVAGASAVVTRWAIVPSRRAHGPARVRPEPPDTSGLDQVDDVETRDFLRTVLYAMRAGAVSLYLLEEGEDLRLAASTTVELERAPPKWFVDNALRFRHLVSTSDISSGGEQAGAGSTGSIGLYGISAVAVPVIDGNIILGVLAMTGTRAGSMTETGAEGFGESHHMALELMAGQFARTLGRGRVQAETEVHMERLKVIQEESARLVTSLDMMAIVGMVAEAVERLATEADLYIFIRGSGGYALAYDRALVEEAREVYSLEGTLMEMSVSDHEHKYFSNLLDYSVPVMPVDAHVASALMLPLQYEDEVLGIIVLASEEVDMLRPRQVDSLRVISDQAAISLKNALFHADIKARALTDGLTGLCNHKHFKSILAKEVQRYTEGMNPLALLIVDVDHFKRVNDTHGHQAGDEVLRGVAEVIRSTVREHDLPARYGGEEFAVLMAGADQAEALRVAERIRKNMAASSFPARTGPVQVTVSIGLASCTMEMKGPSDLVERADQALYQAKAKGRNQTVVAGSDVFMERPDQPERRHPKD